MAERKLKEIEPCTALFMWRGQIARCELPEDHDEEYHEVSFDGRTWQTEGNLIVFKGKSLKS